MSSYTSSPPVFRYGLPKDNILWPGFSVFLLTWYFLCFRTTVHTHTHVPTLRIITLCIFSHHKILIHFFFVTMLWILIILETFGRMRVYFYSVKVKLFFNKSWTLRGGEWNIGPPFILWHSAQLRRQFCQLYPHWNSLVLISVKGWLYPRATECRQKDWVTWKFPRTLPGIKSQISHFVA